MQIINEKFAEMTPFSYRGRKMIIGKEMEVHEELHADLNGMPVVIASREVFDYRLHLFIMEFGMDHIFNIIVKYRQNELNRNLEILFNKYNNDVPN